uniref:Uncharacterized protein n=1 Tax=Tetranychus urticae TaxID=32264 RepID=T1KM29_TETUR
MNNIRVNTETQKSYFRITRD